MKILCECFFAYASTLNSDSFKLFKVLNIKSKLTGKISVEFFDVKSILYKLVERRIDVSSVSSRVLARLMFKQSK